MPSHKFTCPICNTEMKVERNFVYDGVLRHRDDYKRSYFFVKATCGKCDYNIEAYDEDVASCNKGIRDWIDRIRKAVKS